MNQADILRQLAAAGIHVPGFGTNTGAGAGAHAPNTAANASNEHAGRRIGGYRNKHQLRDSNGRFRRATPEEAARHGIRRRDDPTAVVDHAPGFRDALWAAYNKGLVGCCTIKVEDREFKVSTTVLAAHSEVFERMFLMSNSEEAQTGVVRIEDAKAHVIEALIQFMHLGRVDDLAAIATDLFIVADKYNVQGLMAYCSESIGESLSATNIFDFIVLAYQHNCEKLKQQVWKYVSANNSEISNLMASSKWFHFTVTNEQLAQEIMKDMFNKVHFNH